jgi:hypothetical protein
MEIKNNTNALNINNKIENLNNKNENLSNFINFQNNEISKILDQIDLNKIDEDLKISDQIDLNKIDEDLKNLVNTINEEINKEIEKILPNEIKEKINKELKLDQIDLNKINENLKNLANTIKEKINKELKEFKNTPVSKELNPSLLRGLISSGILSSIFLLGNPFLSLGTLLSTAISYKIGEKIENPLYAIISSFTLPLAINSLILLSNSINPINSISLLLTSSIISTIGLLNSTTSKEVNDIKNFSMQTLPINYLLGIPLTVNLVSNFSSSLSSVFEIDEKKKIIFSTLVNIGLAALLALPFGIINFAIFSALSTLYSIINLKAAPKIQNLLDKSQNYLSNKISNFLKDKLSFLSKLPTALRSLIAGLTIGGLSSLSTSILAGLLSPILGPLSFAIPLATFLITTFSTTKSLHTMLKAKEQSLKLINDLESLIENNQISKAVQTYKDHLLNNNLKIDLSKVSDEELKISMLNELIQYHLAKMISYYNDKKLSEAIKEFKYIQFLQLLFNSNDITKAKEITDNLDKDQALKAIENFINSLNNS